MLAEQECVGSVWMRAAGVRVPRGCLRALELRGARSKADAMTHFTQLFSKNHPCSPSLHNKKQPSLSLFLLRSLPLYL